MKEYTIIVENGDHWSLHCLAGHSREWAEQVLAKEKAKHPELNLDIQEYGEEESKGLWWNEWRCD